MSVRAVIHVMAVLTNVLICVSHHVVLALQVARDARVHAQAIAHRDAPVNAVVSVILHVIQHAPMVALKSVMLHVVGHVIQVAPATVKVVQIVPLHIPTVHVQIVTHFAQVVATLGVQTHAAVTVKIQPR